MFWASATTVSSLLALKLEGLSTILILPVEWSKFDRP